MELRIVRPAGQRASLEFIRLYTITMRPYLMFVSGVTGVAGLVLAPENSLIPVWLTVLAAFLSYGFGQALTDCFQIDTDSISSPYRPLTQGRISRSATLLVSCAGLSLCVTIFALGNILNLALGFAAGLGLATYTFFKRRWWGGPWYNSWIVVVLCAMSFLSAGGTPLGLVHPPVLWTLLSVFFGYANFVLSGYFKDIEADRRTAYHTVPVVFGRKKAAVLSDLFTVLTILSVVGAMSHGWTRWEIPLTELSPWFLLGGVFAAVKGQILLHNVRTDEQAHPAVAGTVHSYLLLLSAVAATMRPSWNSFLLIFYAVFVIVLKIRPMKTQI